jgi:hypothetical protein
MFGGYHGFEREIISSAAKTALSTFLFSVKTGPFVCECSQVELRELIYSRHRRAKERMAPLGLMRAQRQQAASQQRVRSIHSHRRNQGDL